jgi:Zn-dependent membrane protease YugP/Tfp pilus assembly protein PilF
MFDTVESFTDPFSGLNTVVITSFLVIVPSLLFTRWVNGRFQQTLAYFLQIASSSGLTGLDVARKLLEHAGISGVRVVPGTGTQMRNHYHPFTGEITLANTIYTSASLSALGIAAHEVGHAVQHARGYRLAWLRAGLVPVTNVCFFLGILTTALGIVQFSQGLMWASVGLFAVCLVFYIMTLLMEIDASARARTLVAEAGLLRPDERKAMGRVLRSASLTYVGRAIQSACGVLGLGLLLATFQFGFGWETGDVPGEMSIWVAVLMPVLAMSFVVGRHKPATGGPSKPKAIESNNAGNLLGEQGDLAGAIAMYSQAIRLDPNLAQAYCNRGTSYTRAGRLDDALADLNRAVQLAPTAGDPRLCRAHLFMMRKEYEAALVDLDEVLRLVPENLAIVRLQQGNVWLEMAQYDQAIGAFTEALDRGGHWPLARCNRALAYLRRGDLRSAVADCDEAIRLAPDLAVAYNNRGTALIKLGDYTAALTDLRTANRLDPQQPNAYKNLAWLQATCPDATFRNGLDAVANATRAIQKAGTAGSEWLDILAAAHAEAAQFQLAVQCQEKYLSSCPASVREEQQIRLDLYRHGQPLRELPSAATGPVKPGRPVTVEC